MLEKLQQAIRIRAFVVFILIHLGLGLGIFALARSSALNGWDATTLLFMTSICCLYGGFLVAILFVLLPMLPWIRRFRAAEHWTERLVRDLPLLLEQIPKLVAAFHSLMAAWNEAKKQNKSNET